MRALAIALVLTSVALDGRAGEPGEPQDLYAVALLAAAEAQAKAYGRPGGEDYYNLVVAMDNSWEPLTNHVPKEAGRFRIAVLDDQGLRERYKKQRKLPVLRLYPARLEDGQLLVGINKYWFSYRYPLFGRPTYRWALEGGAHVKFRYDCDRREFVVADVELWGI